MIFFFTLKGICVFWNRFPLPYVIGSLPSPTATCAAPTCQLPVRKGTVVFPQDSLVVRDAFFFFGNDEGRYSFRSEAGRNTTKVARDACISLSHRRMAPVYFGSYQVLLRIPAKHMLITIHSVLKLHLF